MTSNLNKSPVVKNPSVGIGLNEVVVYGALQMYKGSSVFPMEGAAFDQLAWSIAEGFLGWVTDPLNVVVEGISTGTVGSGVIHKHNTKIIIHPAIPLVTEGLSSAGIVGPLSTSLSAIVTLAVVHALTQFGGYTGVCPTVGVGTDVSKVVISNPSALIMKLQKAMANNSMTGAASIKLAHGLGFGIASLVLTGVGNGKVVGQSGSLPSTGPSFSKVV